MKNLITAVLVLAALAFGGKWAWDKFGSELAADDAQRRVKVCFEGMRSGGDEQAAASAFYEGATNISEQGKLERAWDHWMAWRREGGLGRPIASFEVTGLDLSGEVPIVSVRVEGNSRKVAAPPDDELRWAD